MGGSGIPHPGEVSLAHRGVLFLDEFAEFRNETLQSLRQPLEDGIVTVVRSKISVTYPARFQLIAATNPCPCGNAGDTIRPCTCASGALRGYGQRLSGPIIDRIDIHVRVPRLQKHELFQIPPGEPSTSIAQRVKRARDLQLARASRGRARTNAELPPRNLDHAVRITPDGKLRLEKAVEQSALSARSAHRIMRVARTIADLDEHETVNEKYVDEAINLRVLFAVPNER